MSGIRDFAIFGGGAVAMFALLFTGAHASPKQRILLEILLLALAILLLVALDAVAGPDFGRFHEPLVRVD
ncbi:hypothetical protein ASE00_12510 [Sphingomonas sp. Root710]|uniref:hypothetical protein n=1 Tax=Sphingomonas sp. Root710 TaxID=1736594 RepID=UPI0006F4091F|nr:hypothetical protein [Sphingomonas sp. Root710]KRB82835.1 hypothetical protein ASE00_12510 [Sphingomonas sp. Root710]